MKEICMSLKLVRKTKLGPSVTSYEFEMSNVPAPPVSVVPDPKVVAALQASVEESRRQARGMAPATSPQMKSAGEGSR